MNREYKIELLQGALVSREREITEYQVNIDNYKIAIDLIGDDEKLQEFKAHLKNMLESSMLEQSKAKLILQACQKQLKDLEQ